MRLIRYLLLMLACSAAMAGEQDLTVKQGAQLSVTLTGSEGVLTGRTLRMHVRSKVGVTTTKFVAASTTGELTIASASSATLVVGADVLAAVSVTLPVEYWTYDVESFTTAADVRREWWGRVTITRDVTRDTEATTETALAGVVRYDGPQSLTTAQKLEARTNIGAGTGGGGAAEWGGITGTLTDQTDLNAALGLKAPIASPTFTGTPAAPTAAGATSTTQIATTAFVAGEITTHAGATDPHGDRSFATSAVGTHAALTSSVHGITAAGAALVDDADASAQRTTLGLGTAATQATGAFEAAGAISTHNGVTTAHGISAYIATLTDDADAATARGTLGLGTAAVESASSFAATAHNHAAGDTTSGTFAAARLPIGTDVQAYDADLTTWAGVTPGTGVATFLATPSSTNLAAALTDETGSGAAVFATSPTLVTPALGTPSALVLTNATGLPLSSGVTGQLPLANGGTGAALTDPGADRIAFWDDSAGAVTWLTAGTGLTITATTIDAAGGGGSGDVVGPASAADNAVARYDTTTGKLLQNSGVTVSDVSGSSVTVASTAGNALALAATAPAATTGASVAGKAASLTAAPAVASTDTAGAAAGGDTTIGAGAAARLTSGNANGGSIYLVPGAGIGTGGTGQVLLDSDGTAARPALAFDIGGNTAYGMWYSGGIIKFSVNGTDTLGINSGGVIMPSASVGVVGAGGLLYGFKRNLWALNSSTTLSSLSYQGSTLTNSTAGAAITSTLVSAAVGYTHRFVDDNATYRWTIKPNTADTIIWTDGTVVTAATGSIVSTGRYDSFEVEALDATVWLATNVRGTWTVTP